MPAEFSSKIITYIYNIANINHSVYDGNKDFFKLSVVYIMARQFKSVNIKKKKCLQLSVADNWLLYPNVSLTEDATPERHAKLQQISSHDVPETDPITPPIPSTPLQCKYIEYM